MSAVIRIEDLSKVFVQGAHEVRALDNISLEVEEGDFVAIMGPSGSGKSTLLNILGGLLRPTKGRYILDGIDTSEASDRMLAKIRNERIGFIFQDFNLISGTTALQNVELPMVYGARRRGHRKHRAKELLERLGLLEHSHHRPNQLSGGQIQRVAIARALSNSPAIILADEPTGNLDSKNSKEVLQILTELHEQGNTVLVITHDPEVAIFASRVLTIRDGKIGDDVRNHPLVERPVKPPVRRGRARFFSLNLPGSIANALKGLYHNKVRSFLTMLGIIIGVGSVIAAVSLGEGSRAQTMDSLSSLGTHTIYVFGRNTQDIGTHHRIGYSKGLVPSDVRALRHTLSAVKGITATVETYREVSFEKTSNQYDITGVSEEFFRVMDAAPEEGRLFTPDEYEQGMPVVIIGDEVRKKFFTHADPVGKKIIIEGSPFSIIEGEGDVTSQLFTGVIPPNKAPFGKVVATVVGVLGQKDRSPGIGYDEAVFIPLSTFQNRVEVKSRLDKIILNIRELGQMEQAKKDIHSILLARHNLVEDFFVYNSQEFFQAVTKVFNILTYMVGGIAGISLLVGGIGIMNIMLVSVTERTREIGVRKALGATNFDILNQFLIESSTLSVVGGVIGMAMGISLGLGAAKVITILLEAEEPFQVVFSPMIIGGAFFFSAAVGLFFGLYPAWRAGKQDIVAALHHQ